MNLWILHKFLRWILPVTLFLVVAHWVLPPGLVTSAERQVIVSEEAAFDAAVARHIGTRGTYQFTSEEGMAPGPSTGWHWLLYVLEFASPDLLGIQQFLAILSVLGIFFFTARYLGCLLPGESAFWAALLPLSFLPGLHLLILQAGAILPAGFLVVLGFYFHVQGVQGDRPLLPLVSALCFAVATLLRLECLLLWLLPVLHTLLALVARLRPRLWMRDILIQAASGICLVAICLWPLVDRNLRWSKTPWLPVTDGASGSGALQQIGHGMLLAYDAWGYFFTGLLQFVPALAFVGALWFLVEVLLRRLPHAWLPLPLVVLFGPGLLGLVSAVADPNGLPQAVGILLPFLVVTAFVFPVRLLTLVRVKVPALRFAAPLLAAIFCVLTLLELHARRTLWLEDARYDAHIRQEISSLIGRSNLRVATDQPGRLAMDFQEAYLLDLKGRGARILAYCLAPDGSLDARKVEIVLQDRGVEHVVIWDLKHLAFGEFLMANGAQRIYGDASLPWVLRR